MLYFAYGSNVSLKRMQSRCPGATSLGNYCLSGYLLCFNLHSDDGSGKCNIIQTQLAENCVYGRLYEVPEDEVPWLDQAESLGWSYRRDLVTLTKVLGPTESALTCQAFAYFGLRMKNDLLPFHWYKSHVIHGLVEANMPSEYVASVDRVGSVDDPDKQRQQKELAVYDHG